MPLDIPKDVYTLDIAGETDHGIEQHPTFQDVGLQYNTELLDINNATVLTLPFVAFYKETATVVNLKVHQRIENNITETGMAYKPSVFILKAMLDIFYVSNSPLTHLDEFALTFGIKSGKS